MEAMPWLATGHSRSANARNRTRDAWKDIETALNSGGSGCVKTWQQWCKYWKDKKGAVKRKVSARSILIQRTGGGMEDIPELSEIEQRIVTIMGGESFAVGDRHLEINPFLEPILQYSHGSEGSSTHSESIIQGIQQIGEEVDTQIGDLPAVQLDAGALLPREPTLQDEYLRVLTSPVPSRLHVVPEESNMNISLQDADVTPQQPTQAQQQILSSPRRALRRRMFRQSPAGSTRRAHTVQSSPVTSARRRLMRRSPPSQRRSEMASLTERFIVIEEKRAETDAVMARAYEGYVQGQQAIAGALNQLSLAWSEHARALNALVINRRTRIEE